MPRGIPKAGTRFNRATERRTKRPLLIDPNQFYSVPEVAAARDQCPSLTWQDIAAGRLKATKRDKRTVILGAEVIRLNREEAGSSAVV